MQALLYSDWNTLQLEDLPEPTPGPGEVLLRVAACGICGSELETFKSRSPRRTPPLVMGHEFCGHVEGVGDGVSQFQVGQPVVSNSVVTCGTCRRCQRGLSHLCASRQIFGMHRQGAFAQFVTVPTSCLIDWPVGIPAEQACLSEPLANGLHVYNLTSHLDVETVLVIGAGSIGLMCQQVQQILNSATVFVSDVIPERCNAALRIGASRTFNPTKESVVDQVRELTGGEGVDLVIDAVGSERTKVQSLRAARAGGAIVWIGLHESEIRIESYRVTLQEKSIFGTYAAQISELDQAIKMMSDGSVDVSSWVQFAALEDGVDIFGRMLTAQGTDIKAVILPS